MTIESLPIQKRILLSACKFFSEREYREVTLEEIAEAAGIGKSTIYGHFKSKDILFLDCLNYKLGNIVQEIKKIAKNTDFEAGLKEATNLLLDKSQDTGRMMLTVGENINILKNSKNDSFEPLQIFREWLQNIIPLFETGIASGKLRDDLSAGQMALLYERIFGINLACISFKEPVFTANQVYDIIYNALKK
jgi:AcrR family transcriptional regulator